MRAFAGYYSQAKLYSEKGQFDLAIKNFTAAIQLNEEYAEAYLLRGKAELKAENYQAALDDFVKTLALTPDQAQAWELKRMAESNLSAAEQHSDRR